MNFEEKEPDFSNKMFVIFLVSVFLLLFSGILILFTKYAATLGYVYGTIFGISLLMLVIWKSKVDKPLEKEVVKV